MSECIQYAKDTFGPQLFKTFEGALNSFMEAECPQLGGLRTRQTLVGAIAELVHAHFPSTSHLGQGQIRWTAVHKDEKSSYGKTISQSQLTPVVLDLLPISEIAARAGGAKLRDVKKDAVARLFTQTYEQSGVLTNAEVALLLKLSPSTVGTYRREWEKDHAKLLPTRGSIHDMGPTLTHKKIILQKLIFEGKTVEVVCRETDHSPEAVLRYATNFKQVLMCQSKGLDVTQTAFATKLSKRLIEEHRALADEYRQQYRQVPGDECWQLEDIIKKLDQYQPTNQTPSAP
jgi:DNA-binding CsgD family transcriptional regulator